MPVIEKPKQWTYRGKNFDSKEQAERHEALTVAREELENAQRKFQRVLAESAVTADGVHFEFGVFRDYWQVFKPWNSKPHLRKFTYLCWSWEVRETDKPEVVEIREVPSDGKDSRPVFSPINELYASEKNALAALQIARKEWLEEQRIQIERGEV